jgi:hypothetical protein
MLVEGVYIVSTKFFGISTYFNYLIAARLYKLLFPDKTRTNKAAKIKTEFQLYFSFLE